jgi:hypothetical protein
MPEAKKDFKIDAMPARTLSWWRMRLAEIDMDLERPRGSLAERVSFRELAPEHSAVARAAVEWF